MAANSDDINLDRTSLDIETIGFFQNVSGQTTRADLALAAGRMGSWYHDIEHDQVWGDDTALDLLGFAQRTQPWTMQEFLAAVHPDDFDHIHLAIEEAFKTKSGRYDVEFRLISESRSEIAPAVRWMGARGQVIERDAQQNPIKLFGVFWDITEKKLAEEKMTMLASEMDHRVKNAFAVIRALINIGSSMSNNLDSFADTLRHQVEAMATAHELSARMARMTNDALALVTISDVIHAALAPWIEIAEGSATKVHVDCSEKLFLKPARVAAFAMLLYELSTNATKYGPLGEDGGVLEVTVRRQPDGSLNMDWVEETSRAVDTTTKVAGFGEVLLNHCAHNLGATFERTMTPTGLHFRLVMRAPEPV